MDEPIGVIFNSDHINGVITSDIADLINICTCPVHSFSIFAGFLFTRL